MQRVAALPAHNVDSWLTDTVGTTPGGWAWIPRYRTAASAIGGTSGIGR